MSIPTKYTISDSERKVDIYTTSEEWDAILFAQAIQSYRPEMSLLLRRDDETIPFDKPVDLPKLLTYNGFTWESALQDRINNIFGSSESSEEEESSEDDSHKSDDTE